MILWCIGLFRHRSRPLTAEPETIGLCVLGAIGDALLASAIITDLKQHYRGARVVMLVSRSNAGIVPLLPKCDASLVLPIFDLRRAIAMIRRQHFDLLIDANQWLRVSAIYCALAGAKHTTGFRTPGQYRHYAFDSVAVHSAERHEIENYRALVATAGITGTAHPELKPTRQHKEAVFSQIRSSYIVLHPWAGGGMAVRKEWPNESWIVLGQELATRGYELVVTGAPGDTEKTKRLVEAAGRSAVPMTMMGGRLNLGETGYLLQSATLVVSVNTGVMHMAAALGVPLVALHGPTNPGRWGPISRNAISVVPEPVPAGVPVGYLNLGFEFPKAAPDCMPFISVKRVLSAIDTLIGAPSSASRAVLHLPVGPVSPSATIRASQFGDAAVKPHRPHHGQRT
jgi:heptosyltransferase-3